MFKRTLLIFCLFIGFSSIAGGFQFHHGFGVGGGWQESMGGFAKYNARLNLYNNETWSLSISGSPSFGAEINRPDQNAFRPFAFIPMTADFNWGMGSSFDCLRYKGYSFKIGLAPSTFATMDKEILNDNFKSVPAYVAVDFKFQTKNLRTFSFELGGFATQMNQSYLNDFGVLASFNYYFGIY